MMVARPGAFPYHVELTPKRGAVLPRSLPERLPVRCWCGAMGVDVRRPDGTLRGGCEKCEPLELVDLVRQIFVVKGSS